MAQRIRNEPVCTGGGGAIGDRDGKAKGRESGGKNEGKIGRERMVKRARRAGL
jgi:hypothetical protein